MHRKFLFGTIAAFGLAVCTAAAQDPASQATSRSDQNKNVVVTGCLMPAAPGATSATAGTTGTSGSTVDTDTKDQFILSNAMLRDTAVLDERQYGRDHDRQHRDRHLGIGHGHRGEDVRPGGQVGRAI